MYHFRTLSPLDFEELVRDLLQAEFGLLFESFGLGRDLGIDFRFASARGSAIVQAKHYPESGSAALLRIARKENEKVAKLKPVRYLLATSASLSPSLKGKLQAAMPAAPLAVADIFGRDDLGSRVLPSLSVSSTVASTTGRKPRWRPSRRWCPSLSTMKAFLKQRQY
jgi:Restriction endonuclease